MEGVEAVEVEKLYAFVPAFFGTHLGLSPKKNRIHPGLNANEIHAPHYNHHEVSFSFSFIFDRKFDVCVLVTYYKHHHFMILTNKEHASY